MGLNVALVKLNCHLFYQLLRIYHFVANIFLDITFLTLCAVTFERFLALKIFLRYRELVTVRRILLLLGSIWLGALGETEWSMEHRFTFEIFQVVCFVPLAFFSSLWCYFKIFQIVRHHQSQIQYLSLVVAKSVCRILLDKRSLYVPCNTSLVSFSYPISPAWVCFHLVNSRAKKRDTADILLVRRFLVTLTCLNSCINLFLYCWRLREIRQAVKETMTALF